MSLFSESELSHISRLKRFLVAISAAPCLMTVLIATPAVAATAAPEQSIAQALVAEAEAPPYRIGRGDDLDLKFFYAPELNTLAMVRSDGRIAIPLIGEVRVEGLTLQALTDMIVASLSRQVRRPEVSINLRGSGSQRVFVGGEVGRPGVQPLLGGLSLAQAVMAADGLKDTAGTGEIVVIRRGAQGERLALRSNLAAVLDGSDPGQDIALQASDVVVVPRSGVANLNLWVDQYLRRNLPISLSLGYTINRGTAYP